MIIKHLYQRTITKNGKKIKAWYYWYYDENNKQVRKSCGSHGKPCLLKREAEAYIANLTDDDLFPKKSNKITFNQFCKGFYDTGSKFLVKQKNRGIKWKPNTIYQRQHYLTYFLDKFGEFPVDEVNGSDFDNWLLELPFSASVRNHIQMMIEEIEEELYSYHLINTLPLLKRYKRNDTKEKGVLTVNEIEMLYPDSYEDIVRIWTVPNSKETEFLNFQFAVMIYTIVSTGMRSCEIRALKWEQFVRPDAILINAMIDSSDERVNTLKKGSRENKKWRVVILPEKTTRLLQQLKLHQDKNEVFVFTRYGEPVTTYFLLEHLKIVLKKNNIDVEGRNLTVHSLRFTYNTIMRPEIDEKDLRSMVGHVSESMTDYYDMSKALDKLPVLLKNKSTIDSIWK